MIIDSAFLFDVPGFAAPFLEYLQQEDPSAAYSSYCSEVLIVLTCSACAVCVAVASNEKRETHVPPPRPRLAALLLPLFLSLCPEQTASSLQRCCVVVLCRADRGGFNLVRHACHGRAGMSAPGHLETWIALCCTKYSCFCRRFLIVFFHHEPAVHDKAPGAGRVLSLYIRSFVRLCCGISFNTGVGVGRRPTA